MQAYNTSDAWSLVGLNASAVASTFSPMMFIVAFSRELTSTLLDIPDRVCLPYIMILEMQISNPCVGKQCLRCMASCRIRHFCHCLHIQMHSHTHLFRFIHSHARYLACSQKSFPFATRNQLANGTKCSRTGHSCSRTGSVRGWDGTYIIASATNSWHL